MMEKLGEPQTHLGLKAMIKEVDEDHDNQISFREVWGKKEKTFSFLCLSTLLTSLFLLLISTSLSFSSIIPIHVKTFIMFMPIKGSSTPIHALLAKGVYYNLISYLMFIVNKISNSLMSSNYNSIPSSCLYSRRLTMGH